MILLGGAQIFFEGNLVAIVESPDRAYSYFHLLLGAQAHSDLVERQIRLLDLGNEFEQPLLVLLKWRADVTGARLRLDAAGLRPALDSADRSRGADIEQPCRLPRALAILDNRNHSCPKTIELTSEGFGGT